MHKRGRDPTAHETFCARCCNDNKVSCDCDVPVTWADWRAIVKAHRANEIIKDKILAFAISFIIFVIILGTVELFII